MILRTPNRGHRILVKQQGQYRIRWSHDLAYGLGFAAIATEGGLDLVDLVDGLLLTAGGSARMDGDTGSPVYRTASANARYSVTLPTALRPAKAVTLLWHGVNLAAASNHSTYAGATYDTGVGSPYACWNMGTNNSGLYRWTWNRGGVYDEQLGGSVTLNQSRVHVLAMDDVTGNFYAQGAQVASKGTTGGDISYHSTAPLHVGEAYSSLSRNPNCITWAVYVWPNRKLTAGEVADISTDPYQILEPVTTRRRGLVVAAVTGRIWKLAGVGGGLVGKAGGLAA